MFNAQAAISTVFLMAMMLVIYIGWLFAMFHRWWAMRAFGITLILAAVTGIVSHMAALIVGA